MTERRGFNSERIDFQSGYPIVWESLPNLKTNIVRNLVMVPMEDKVNLLYKRRKNIFKMSPSQNPEYWTLEGKVKPWDINNLGLKVSYDKESHAPYMSSYDLEVLSDSGLVQPVEGTEELNVSLWLPELSILTFLFNVWDKPGLSAEETTAPSYRLRDYNGNFRLLPQKVPAVIDRSPKKPSLLQVIRK